MDPERLIRIRIQIRPSQEVMDPTGSGSTQPFVDLRHGAEFLIMMGKKWMKQKFQLFPFLQL